MNIDLPAKFKKTSLCCHVRQEIEESRRCEARRIEVCGAMPAVSIYDYCVFERDGITNYRPFSGGPKYYCEKHKREPEEVMPKIIDIKRFNLNGH